MRSGAIVLDKMRIHQIKPDHLLVTDPPSRCRIDNLADELIPFLSGGGTMSPGLLIAAPDGRWLILDGNNRACLSCALRRTFPVFSIARPRDADHILRLEADGSIPMFPHREFLAGRQSVANLARQAWIAFEG
jgi:hypothetical protein